MKGELVEALTYGLSASRALLVRTLLFKLADILVLELGEQTEAQANDIAGFRKILVPMIRRIIPGSIPIELVGVSPQSGPTGLVYHLRYKYGESIV